MTDTPFVLPDLPYATDAFGTVISARTFSFHHGKHHKAYVETANRLAGEAGLGKAKPSEIIKRTYGDATKTALFNNAAQAWNHSLYWRSLSPSKKTPEGALAKAIDASFDNFDAFQRRFAEAAAGQFGSGWAWLVREGKGGLKIVTTSNADTPAARGEHCLLVVDVWEHAYYLDHQNVRRAYVDAVVNDHLDWAFAAENFDAS
jgi:superoxide dismutase, Fe-Mn family